MAPLVTHGTLERAKLGLGERDPKSGGLMFEGGVPSLEHYVLCIAQIRQCQRILVDCLIADGEGIHPAYTAQKAIRSARLLAVELGLSVVSGAQSFRRKSADTREWDELDVG
jgi:hypothetical protein